LESIMKNTPSFRPDEGVFFMIDGKSGVQL